MQTDVSRLWVARIVTFIVSALAATSMAYWGLKAWGRPTSFAAPAVAQQTVSFNSQAIAQALGAGSALVTATATAAPAAISRYGLVGVVAGLTRAGAALISVDGQEAKPVRVGTLVDNDMVLESVSGRQAVLISSTNTAQKIILDMPMLAD